MPFVKRGWFPSLFLVVVLTSMLHSLDCNENGVDDIVDLENASSEDCNENQILDECEVAPPDFAPTTQGVPLAVRGVALGSADFDGDADLDFVVAVRSTVAAVKFFLNEGAQAFSERDEHALSDRVRWLAVADIDGDENMDVATANGFSVDVLLGNGDGTFEAPVTHPLAVEGRHIVIADLDGDGLPEIIAPGRETAFVSILSNMGDGEFVRSEVRLVDDAVVNPDLTAVAVEDFNLDGQPDIAALGRGTRAVIVALGDGAGFAEAASYPLIETVSSTSRLWTADLTGDGLPDILSKIRGNVAVLENRGDGSFEEVVYYESSGVAMAVEDFNGDGALDVLSPTTSPPGFQFRYNDGNGGLGVSATLDATFIGLLMETGDFDGNLSTDIAVMVSRDGGGSEILHLYAVESGTRSVFTLQSVNLPFQNCPLAGNGCRPHSGAVTDLDGDGDLDVAGVNTHPGSFSVAINEDGFLVPRAGYRFGINTEAGGEHPQSVAAGDVDGDGDPDLVTVDNRSNDLWVHLNLNNWSKSELVEESFQTPERIRVGTAPINVQLGDLDGDGDLDAVSANQGASSVSILLGDGAGSFAPGAVRDLRVGPSPKAIALGDVDLDGDLDIVVASLNGGGISMLLGVGDGSFAPVEDFRIGSNPNHVELGDVDGDDDLDVVTANTSALAISVLLNQVADPGFGGGPLFGPNQDFAVGRGPYSLKLVDFDLDGILDVVTTNEFPENASTLSILTGAGDGTFGLPFHHRLPGGFNGLSGTRFAFPVDLDLDGDWDLVSVNRGGRSVTPVYNNSLGPLQFVERICTPAEFSTVAAEGSGRDGVQRFVKYLMPVDAGNPSLLPIVFQDTKTFRLHEDFLREVFSTEFPVEQYSDLTGRRATRQYYVGGISRIRTAERAVYGFSVFADYSDPEERLSIEEVAAVRDRLAEVFRLEPFGYFPSTDPAKEIARTWEDPGFPVFFGESGEALSFEAYTRGIGFGRVRILTPEEFEEADASGQFSLQDIVVLKEAPRDIQGVVGGVVTAQRQGELSHVAVRTARRGTPNFYLRDACDVFERWEGRLVRLAVTTAGHSVRAAAPEEAEAFWEAVREDLSVPPSVDAEYVGLPTFEEILEMERMGVPLVARFGGKGSNLARLQAHLGGEFSDYQERGFVIPVHYYQEFMRANTIRSPSSADVQVTYEEFVDELLGDETFRSDSVLRFQALEFLRDHMEDEGRVNADLVEQLASRINEVLAPEPTTRVRFRSSSNVEDAVEFNGAGLYRSTAVCLADQMDGDDEGPSLCDPEKNGERTIERALKRVWSSLWNYSAFEERSFYRIDQRQAAMGVLVNRAFIDEQVNGVAFTGNPANPSDRRYVVSAQVGETSVVSPDPGVLPEKNILEVEDGVVVDIIRAVRSSLVDEGSVVLSDAQLEELGAFLYHIDQNFPVQLVEGVTREDIFLDFEFKVEASGDLAVKQVRPFLVRDQDLPDPTFELLIPPQTVACGQFKIGRSPRDEYELKSRLYFAETPVFLPTSSATFEGELMTHLELGQSQEVALPVAPGLFRVSTVPRGGGVAGYSFDYEQTFELAGGGLVELKLLALEFRARDGEPLDGSQILDDELLTHELFLEAELVSGGGELGALVSYSSCTQETLPLQDVRVELEDGTRVVLTERFDAAIAAQQDFSPASVVAAEVFTGGAQREVTDYLDLVYSADKHNAHVEYWVVLEPPLSMQALEAPVHVVHLVPPQLNDPTAVSTAFYLDENLEPIRELRISDFSRQETVERIFRRGDVDANGALQSLDALVLLVHLFVGGGAPICEKAADVNDDGQLNVADPVLVASQLFNANIPLIEPVDCGPDPTPDTLSCESFLRCP